MKEGMEDKVNNWINKLERKFGRYAVRGLMKYIIILYVVGTVLNMINPYFYSMYLSLDYAAILHGQVWRLVTFILQPMGSFGGFGALFLLITLYFYWMIGNNLERAWGAFRFNLYYVMGVVLQILAGLILYLVTGDPYSGMYFGLDYINQSMFLAFCVLYPNMQVLLMYILPIKVKYLGIIYAAVIGFDALSHLVHGRWYVAVAILVAIANFLIFFFSTRNYRRISPQEYRRKAAYRKAVQQPKGITRHKCAICGRTEQDDPNLEFRFCSKCEGNYEYCQDHLFTHQHVKK